MSHRLSLAFLTLHDCSPVEAVRVAALAGYDMLGLRLLPSAQREAPHPLMEDASVRRDVRAALADTGVTVGDVEIARLGAAADIEDFEPFLERAAELGARHVLVAGDDPDTGRLTASFAAFCRLCRGFGLTADLEFMPWTMVPDLASARTIVEAAGEDNGGVLVDALHFDRCGATLEELRVLPSRYINYVQICDGPAEYGRDHAELIRIARSARLLPGEGGIDCIGLIGAIPDGVTVSVEVANHELARTNTPIQRAEMAMAATLRVLERAGRSRAA